MKLYYVNYVDWNASDHEKTIEANSKQEALELFHQTVSDSECKHVESVVQIYKSKPNSAQVDQFLNEEAK